MYLISIHVIEYVYVQNPMEVRRGHQIPWNWTTDNCELMWILGSKPGSFTRSISAFDF